MPFGPVTLTKLGIKKILQKLRCILAVILLYTYEVASFLIRPDTSALGRKDEYSL